VTCIVKIGSKITDSVLTGSGTVSPSAPETPTTPDSPQDPDNPGSSKKIPVRRSNSSPEMSSTWKPSHLNLQKDIEEQDEEEQGHKVAESETLDQDKSVETVPTKLTSEETATTSSPANQLKMASEDTSHTYSATSNPTAIMKGNTSPFRRSYEAIPEENLQKSGSLGSSPEGKGQADAIVPMKRDRISTISVGLIQAKFCSILKLLF